MRVAIAGGTGTIGRHVVRAAQADGHEVVVLSRATGVDLVTGTGLEEALAGVEVLIDVTNAGTSEEGPATEFFRRTAGNVQELGARHGLRRVILLSIVGIDRATRGYYVAKMEQERAALEGPVPATILRATQFHEFAGQMLHRNRRDNVARVPAQRVRTAAARSVAAVLVELLDSTPGYATEVAGPEEADLVAECRAFAEKRGLEVTVLGAEPNGGTVPGALLPQGEFRVVGPTFTEWLDTADAAELAL